MSSDAAFSRSAQSLSASAAFRVSPASARPYDASAVRAASRTSSLGPACGGQIRVAKGRRPAGRLHPPDGPRGGRADPDVGALELRQQDLVEPRRLQPRQPVDRRGDDALVLVVEHRAEALDGGVGRHGLEHVGNRGADAPVLIGLHPGEHREKPCGIDRRHGAHGRRAHRRPVVGQQVLDVGQRGFALERGQRGHRLEAHVRIGLLGGQDRQDGVRRVGVAGAKLREGSDRRHGHRHVAAGLLQHPAQVGNRGWRPWLRPCRGRQTRACRPPELFASCLSAGRARGSLIRCSANATGHQVEMLAGLILHGRAERLPRLLAHEREEPETDRVGLRRLRPLVIVGRKRRDRPLLDVGRHHLADGGGRAGVADEPQRFGGAAADARIGVLQRGGQRRHRGLVGEQPQPEGGHLPHVGVRIGQQRLKRRGPLRQPDAPDRERRAPADPRVRVGGERREIGRHHWRRRRFRFLALLLILGNRGRDHRRRRRRAQDPLILQPEDPAHL